MRTGTIPAAGQGPLIKKRAGTNAVGLWHMAYGLWFACHLATFSPPLTDTAGRSDEATASRRLAENGGFWRIVA